MQRSRWTEHKPFLPTRLKRRPSDDGNGLPYYIEDKVSTSKRLGSHPYFREDLICHPRKSGATDIPEDLSRSSAKCKEVSARRDFNSRVTCRAYQKQLVLQSSI